MTASVADILDRAADLIERGQWEATFGGGILYRAIDQAACDLASATSAVRMFQGFIDTRCAATWAAGRTQAEVVAAFREAAAKARSEGQSS